MFDVVKQTTVVAVVAIRQGRTQGRAEVEPIYVALADRFHQRSTTETFVLNFRTRRRSSGLGSLAYD